MYTSDRLTSTIPSPSLHLLGSDAGLRAQLPIILSSPSDDGKKDKEQYTFYTRPAAPPVPALPNPNREKGLPDIPPHVQALAKLEGSTIPSSFFGSTSKPKIQLKPITGAIANARVYNPKSPVEQVRKVFNGNGTGRKLLGAHQPSRSKDMNKSDISLPIPQADLLDVIDISPAASTDTLPLSLHLTSKPSTSSSSSSTASNSSSSALAVPPSTPPPRSASSRKGPPAPIRIPNGRIHAPAIIVERDADLADLESRISVGIRTPKVPRRSTRRKRRDMTTRVEPPKVTMPAAAVVAPIVPTLSSLPPIMTASTTTPSIRTSVATSITGTDYSGRDDGNMTETSNDEFRFSLGFLMQPERQSVMTQRTGRADSATLPELSPFLASESYIPPVPSIPASLLQSAQSSHKSSDATPLALGGDNRSRSTSPSLRRNTSIGDISSPLASAYSQLTANARKRRETRQTERTDFSHAFTAASPLESPERYMLPTIRPINLAKRNNNNNNENGSEKNKAVVDSRREGAQREDGNGSGSENGIRGGGAGSVPGSAQASPLARRVLTNNNSSSNVNEVFRKDSLTDSNATRSPGSGSMYSSLDTPELSPPARNAKRSNNNTSTESSTPDSFEIINPTRHLLEKRAERSESPYSFSTTSSQRRHRELPKSAVPMSAVSPQSTSSIDHYLDSISFSNNSGSISAEPLERWPMGPSPPASDNPFSASAMEAFRKAHQGGTFAPSHMPVSAPGPAGPESTNTTTATATTTKPVEKKEPRKLVFPPLPLEDKQESMKEVKIMTASIRERRNSMPSPSGLSPDLMNRRPSAPSPLTGGPSTILFTPSAHQPLHAALSAYSSSTQGGFPTSSAAGKLRALDDSNIRGSNLSIKTDHIRTVPRRGLVPYTPFSQGSDSFSPATALLTGARSAKMPLTGLKTSIVPNSALSTSVSVKLATRARTRPPSGPRKPRHSNSTKSKDKIPTVPMIEESVLASSRSRSASESQTTTRASISPYPPTPTFETQLVRFKGLTLDVAKWTFSQEELQEVTRRAICQSSDPMSIRLLPAKILDEDIPAELERLVLQREELKANYKYQYRRRMGVLKSLSALSEGTVNGSVAAKLVEDLMDIGIKSDQIGEEMYVVSDQISQLRALQESHSASALAMALRKINSSFIKLQAEAADLKSQVADVTAEREDAWAMADTLEKELNEVKAVLEKETSSKKEQLLSPPIKRLRRGVVPANISTGVAPADEPSPLKSGGSRVTAARNVSIRRSKASLRSRYSMTSPQPMSALHTSGSIHSSYYGSQASASLIPPVPPLNSALASAIHTASIHTASVVSSAVPSAGPTSATRMPKRHSTALSRRSSSFSGTPHSSSRALIDAQNDLLKILGVPVKGMSEGGFRRTRSFSDAGLRASMLPDSPPAAAVGHETTLGGLAAPQGANSRESRITSFYGAYLSRSNTVAGNRMTVRRQTGASQWDMEAIYDGILDDPDTLFAVVRPGL
ncbi:hypothetical protein CPB86DRAFT_822004 [Serendipita vermifera]|nr:hypothetical protein CPB86DRAFT_822004 [Serendipita vermifera]